LLTVFCGFLAFDLYTWSISPLLCVFDSDTHGQFLCCRASAKDSNEARTIDETVDVALQKFSACEEKIKLQKLQKEAQTTTTGATTQVVKQHSTSDKAPVMKNAQGSSNNVHAGASPRIAAGPRAEKKDNGKTWTDWIADGLGLGQQQSNAKDVASAPKPAMIEQAPARQNQGEACENILMRS
jgi:hypothetical protein